MKIVGKGQTSRDVSPLFQPHTLAARERERAKELKQLLEARARWNATRRDTSANDFRRTVLLYSWEKGFIENKPNNDTAFMSGNVLRKNEQKKSGKALTIPLMARIIAEHHLP